MVMDPGLLTVATCHFLISICDREQVAQVRGRPIYKITHVALIPLSSQADADKAITAARAHVTRQNSAPGRGAEDSDSDSEEGAPSVTDSLLEDHVTAPPPSADAGAGQKGTAQARTSVAEDVMQRKGVYGRFADKWFSRKGWSADNRRLQGLRSDEDLRAKNVPANVDSIVSPEDADPPSPPNLAKDVADPVSPKDIPTALQGDNEATTVALLPKILQTTQMYFSSGNFFFAYDYDISHGIGQQSSSSSLPLFQQFDPLVRKRHSRCYATQRQLTPC